ncbi:MAG TPA: LacI family DNA-binding transcriptional regulator [Clostridia bacterium]|nr:LacI family DNA-binding transcriptional regulator [Clostridia bacterium]
MPKKEVGADNFGRMTKKEIAIACGVSRITLDRVLGNKPGVGAEKRAEILAFLEKNGYRENRLAQSLVRGKSHSFGIIVFDLDNSFYAQLVNAFQRAAQEAGYVSYIMLSNKDPRREKDLLEDLLARQVEGIVLNSAVKESGYGTYLLGQGTPILSVMNQVGQRLPFLGFDESASMRELVRYALGQGYRRFFYVCPPLARASASNMDSLLRRKLGFDEEMATCPQAEVTVLGDSGYLDALLKAEYRQPERPCILCTSDVYAVEILRALREIGVEPPRDYAIAGYDNIPLLHSFKPRLTTVSLHIAELGAKAAQLLIRAAAGEALPPKTLMPHTLLRMDTL